MELGHILWPSDPVTRESSDSETQLTRWRCSIMNSKCRLMLQTNVCNDEQEVCQFYRCLAFGRFWKVKFWRAFIKCQFQWRFYGFSQKYISVYLYLGFFENRKNSGLTPGQNNDPVTQTWKMTQMTHWPGDPMTQFHVWPTLYTI